MAALVVQSRFAGLKIEDDDYPSSSDGQKSKKTKPSAAKKPEPPKKNNKNPTKPQNAPKKKKSKPIAQTAEQWEQWKQKDEELVDGNYESELQQAILLSKLDYEEKKDVYKQLKKESEMEKKVSEQPAKSKKQKKKNVMSLDQFNDMVNHGDEPKYNHEDEKQHCSIESKSPQSKDTEFFERVKDEAKSELLKDKIIDRVRSRKTMSDDIFTRVQFVEALAKKDKEIAALKDEIGSLKDELLTVKSRNKKLCNILGQGEMKEKAEVLVEVERLRGVQAELTAEMASLHTALQQERSKHTATAHHKKNSIKKKNIRFDVSSEAIPTKESKEAT